MPWTTQSGTRSLLGPEADLVRGAIGTMVDSHVDQIRDDRYEWQYGVPWFDQWDPGQRLWLLDHVTRALLGHHMIASPAAMFDSAVDAIFCEILDLIRIEISDDQYDDQFYEMIDGADYQAGGTLSRQQTPTRSWRQGVINALATQQGSRPNIDASDCDLNRWIERVTWIADEVIGIRHYQKAEAFRDVDYSILQRFLRDRALPEDYLERIPPLPRPDEVQHAVDRIQGYVFSV
ncbi:hypothetical protein SV7mr_01310 [Stieleria bergensis]|uniref:Uncharacterized protein n=1 Tax=Stieleria bergensis TaxID=2528025 RepID=A0A517SNF2_9BACT|nr:hypothetical protein SV7mr_01310 [Planctomycetes bacterium SV_7m_r]